MPIIGWPLEHPILNTSPSINLLQLHIGVQWMHIQRMHFLVRQSLVCQGGTFKKALRGISKDSRAQVSDEHLGKAQPGKSWTLSNRAHYLHLKNSALTRRLAEHPAQGRQMNARKRKAWRALFDLTSNVKKGKEWKDWEIFANEFSVT